MFVYPNHKGMNMLPPGVALLSACLKREGINVSLFDTTYYHSTDINNVKERTDSDKSKSDNMMARPLKMANTVTVKYTNVFDDFNKEVENFSPDLLALSVTEDMFLLGIDLLRQVRKFGILTIAGGVFPTFAPELTLSYPEIDIVCKGEGEVALVELCRCIEQGKDFSNINNLWVKKKEGFTKINPTRMVDMDSNPLLDLSIFEEARFYRPMAGKVYRIFPVETHRGCPYTCAFCNSPSQNKLYKESEGKSYLRRKSFDRMKDELLYYKNEMKAEYLYFWADTFFSWKRGEFEEFAELYKEINLPFWCQTRVETIKPYKLEILKSMNIARMSFGLEHGNQVFRKEVVDRRMPNKMITDTLNMVYDSGIPFSVNNIIGFPYENRDLAFDTIEINRTFKCNDRNAYPFSPFSGTPLRKTCEKLGYLKKNDIVTSFVPDESILDMPQFPAKKVKALCKVFNFYVNFPKSRWPEIEKAEEDTSEGRLIYSELKEEFMKTFWQDDGRTDVHASFEDVAEGSLQ